MTIQQEAFEKLAQSVIQALNKRNMDGYYFETSKACTDFILSMIPEGSSVSFGGSETLKETGMLTALHNGKYSVIDRAAAKNETEMREIYARTVLSDYFFMSTNAITTDGILVNIDGNANRVACLCQGPRHVFILAGKNKFVSSVEEAVSRIHCYACPPNAIRLKRNTPCAATGICGNCLADDCFCNQIVVTRRSKHKGRIHVFLINENLGF